MLASELLTPSADLTVVVKELPPADENPALVYLASLGNDRSRRTMRQNLDVIADIVSPGCDAEPFPWAMLRFQRTNAIRTRLAERYVPATANCCLAALRDVLKAAWRLGQITAEEHARACDLNPISGETLPAGRGLEAGELPSLFDACARDTSPAGARDAAILGVLYGGGLRRSEAAALDIADYDQATGTLTVQHGKGNKARLCYLAGGAMDAVGAWLKVRGAAPGPLFWPIDKGGNLERRGITSQAIYNMLRKRAEEASVKRFSPHDLRRSFVSDLLDAGGDLATVQKLAGHSSPTTTARYDRRPEAAKRRAAGLLHVPFVSG